MLLTLVSEVDNTIYVVYVTMEDGTGIADVTVFSNVQQKCGNVLFKEVWLIVTGKVQRRGPKSLSIIAEELSDLRSTCDLPVVSL